MTMTRHTRLARWAALALLAGPAVAGAQEEVKPEVLLLIDTSQSMELRDDRDEAPTCAPEHDGRFPVERPDGLGELQRSRIMTAKEVLTGTFLHQPWCMVDDRDDHLLRNHVVRDGSAPVEHFRPMCCADGPPARADDPCRRYAPCGSDNGRPGRGAARRDATGLGIGAAFDDDGLIYQNRRSIKFSLMTFDGHPEHNGGRNGQFSFPDPQQVPAGDGVAVPQAVADAVGQDTVAGIATLDGATGVARGITTPNLGARRWNPPIGGGLIPANWGNTRSPEALVGEDAASVESHNLLVMDEIRRLVPVGHAPVAALLRDALAYFQAERGELDGASLTPEPIDLLDRAAACRKRVAVLVTNGKPTEYYGGQSCNGHADCGDRGRCVVRGGEQVCAYPEGYPYRTSEEYAAELYDRGIPLFVVGFNVDAEGREKARSIAANGSPGLGPEGGPGFFLANDRLTLRDALVRVTNAAMAGFRTRTAPLIVNPGPGDRVRGQDIRQFRLNAFTEVPGAGDAFKYGRVVRSAYGCPRNPDPDRRGMLEPMGSIRFDERLAAEVNAVRRVVSRSLDRRNNIVVAGGEQPMFDANGALAGGVALNVAADMLGVEADDPQGDEDDDDPFRRVGMLVNGFFGERGRPDDEDAGRAGERQLGAILDGDMVAIPPPALGIEDPSYVAFEAAHRDRPTLIAVGANDGMVHVFRAKDGHEVFNFIPRLAWGRLEPASRAAVERVVDGPLDAGEVVECRNVAGGPRACRPGVDALQFRTMLVGGTGRGGRNLFGIDVTNLGELADEGDDAAGLRVARDLADGDAQRPFIWNLTHEDEPKLGYTVSRPLLTHVRIGGEVRAAAVAGCGDDGDPARVADVGAPGRCVLVIDAVSGEVIRRIEMDGGGAPGAVMDHPVVGWPVAFPAGGIAPAERVYVGDKIGRLWRIDLRSRNPADWEPQMIWPPADAGEALGYVTGRPIVGRPAVAVREDGRTVIVFVTGGAEDGDADVRSHVVSLTDEVVFDADGGVSYRVRPNWVLPLRRGEVGTGSPVIREGVAFFTTVEPREDVCASAQGRLYGVHYHQTLRDADGDPLTFALGDRQVNVKPMLPTFRADGTPGPRGLAVVLPPGRVAYGVAVVTTPTCAPGELARTEAILNLADEERGAAGNVNGGQSQVETVEGRRVQASDIDGRMFARAQGSELSICLNCSPDGRAAPGARADAPFPSVVTSWGSTFLD